jgi:NAD-dependent dihydropyrimidine dehydrogenase PreA subunit
VAKVKITINHDKCNGCEECVLSCPGETLEIINGRTVVARPEDCIICRTCEQICPENAIIVSEE